jgi:molybdopterin-containing oxidoreductase family iron-sulfur binding subunit
MSKRIFHHPPEAATGKRYWRSLGQLADTSEFRGWLEREFPQGASEMAGDDLSRRSFLHLMGASMALAGLSFAGCRRPEKHLVPFTRGTEWSIPGKALFFATSMPTPHGALPLVVTTYDGRPTKIEGNPMHPVVAGKTDTHAQASILDLYDPDRSRFFWRKERSADKAIQSDPDSFNRALDTIMSEAGDGTGIAFLLEKDHSPTRERLREEIAKKFPAAIWAVYEPLAPEPQNLFGEGMSAVTQLDKADVILALDADFLGTDGTVATQRQFTARRKVEENEKMNRLYVVENRYTVTGGMADHRLRLPASQIGAFARALAGAIASAGSDASSLDALVKLLPASTAKVLPQWLKEAAADLVASKGKSVVLVGARQPAAVQSIVASINATLGALGTSLVGRSAAAKTPATIAQLAKEMGDGKIKTLFILGGNPAYNAPSDLGWDKLQEKVLNVIRLGRYEDETSELSTWHVPAAHYLESWGDGRAFDGSLTAIQPMILPLYGGWSELDLLARVAGHPKPEGPELVQETFRQVAPSADFVTAWPKFLHDGFLADSAAQPESLAVAAAAASADAEGNVPAPAFDEKTWEIVFAACTKVHDGRFANNGWLQELPDPITKQTWDNAAQISPASAAKIGVKDGDFIEIGVENRSLRIPVVVAPGHADQSLTIPLGYGRHFKGRIGGRGDVGFNAYPLRTTAAPYFSVGATVRRAGGRYAMAITQEHGSMEGRGADLVREGTVEMWKQQPDFAKALGIDAHAEWEKNSKGQRTQLINRSLYSHPPLTGIHQWGMTIDMSTCTGCSACMIACQAENNIPIVGKKQVINGREMHWIRTDRYFASDTQGVDEPELVSQPMLCQHCENAPCETVCPVNATVHSDDGINVMAYNRCVGTRYCANNCPFKVRRFNFFDYHQRKIQDGGLYEWNWVSEKGSPETLKMQKNPNVTVRMRGVMEKCTFCIQRVQEAKIAAKVKARDSNDVKIPTDSFTTACAQTCPNDAITFGDISDPNSAVSKLRVRERGYRLLEYLNVNTRTWYFARIRNPNPRMPGADKIGGWSRPQHHGEEQHAPEAHSEVHG